MTGPLFDAEPYRPPEIPCRGRARYRPLREDVDEWTRAFPNIDVRAELLRYVVWAKANPKKRKTLAGCKSSVVTWLSRENAKADIRKQDERRQREARPVQVGLSEAVRVKKVAGIAAHELPGVERAEIERTARAEIARDPANPDDGVVARVVARLK